MVLAAYLLLGAFAGLSAGLLGVGGGLIIVPALAALFAQQGFSGEILMHLALGTSLATIVVTSLSSVYAHHRHGAVLWPQFRQLAPGILLGAWLGGWLAGQMSSAQLKPVFALFELAVGIYMLSDHRTRSQRGLPGSVAMGGVGGGIGLISSLVGIGGGTLTVPYLHWHGAELRRAIATSAACGMPIAIAGSLSYIVNGWSHPQLPGHSLGFVHLPSLLAVVVSSVVFAPIGARLAHRLPVKTVKRLFALLLLLIAVRMLLSEF